MDSHALASSSSPVLPAALPGWAVPRGGAAFAAGVALKSLDDLVRAAPAWAIRHGHEDWIGDSF
ncbi:hypothetical protein [Aquamicrobium terrae]|uniref:Uncharacterized protein n=1 Tax=Aquamicrobium terrae TaxID=1324945 RepID=A0ABV2N1F8_9HYPH